MRAIIGDREAVERLVAEAQAQLQLTATVAEILEAKGRVLSL